MIGTPLFCFGPWYEVAHGQSTSITENSVRCVAKLHKNYIFTNKTYTVMNRWRENSRHYFVKHKKKTFGYNRAENSNIILCIRCMT